MLTKDSNKIETQGFLLLFSTFFGCVQYSRTKVIKLFYHYNFYEKKYA